MKLLYSLLVLLLAVNCYAQSPLLKAHGNADHQSVHCAMQDRNGNIWFATTTDGVYKYDGKVFTNYTTSDGLISNVACSILEDKGGDIWISTDVGISRYDGKKFTNTSTAAIRGQFFMANIKPVNRQMMADAVTGMMMDKTGRIWLALREAIYCYDGKYFTRFLDDKNVVNKNGLRLEATASMLEDSKGNIWFTTWFEGLCCYDGKTLTNYKPNNEVWFAGLFEDRDGMLWIGRRGKGMLRYDGNSFADFKDIPVLNACAVTAITQDKQGDMWFATTAADMTKREYTGGVWRYDGKTFRNFTKKDGLKYSSIWCLLPDRTGNLWVGTGRTGLSRYDGKSFTSFTE
jgi:ligand-binding sensor domain-containing protein